KNSAAKRAFDKAFENQVICGIGNFGVQLDYARDDVFEQDITVFIIPHPLAVVWDRNAVDPTGKDARHCFVAEVVTKDEYNRRWPKAKSNASQFGAAVDQWARQNGWYQSDDRRVVTVWRMVERTKRIAMFQNGSIIDVTDME